MVKARIKLNNRNACYGFTMRSHATGIVCAAASALAINAVNSIEMLTSAKCVANAADSGYLDFSVLDLLEGECPDAELLLKSFVLGISEIGKEHPKEIKIEGLPYK
jgi:uncharacterized protein YsxB (DUF464 family)